MGAPASTEEKKEAADKSKANDKPKKELPKPITYTGKVVDRDTGKPIAGATVEVTHELSRDPKTGKWITLHTTTHKSNDKGEYSFTLPPEEVAEPSLYLVVNAHHPEYQSKGRSGYSHSMIRKNLANGEPPFYATIKLSSGEAITAAVLQPDGTPAANTQVLSYSKPPSKEPVRSFERGAFQYSQTDENGRFRIVVATPGDGVLWVFPKNASPIAHRIGDQRGDMGPFKLQEGARLGGQVLDAKGEPVANVAVNLDREGDGEEADEFLHNNAVANAIGTGAKTDEQGRFQLKPLPPGTYRAKVSEYIRDQSVRENGRREELKVDHVFTPLEVTIREGEPNDPIEIRAVPYILIRGRFFNSKGEPRASHQQDLFARMNDEPIFARSTRPGEDGWFEFKVPHGAENVQVSLSTNEHSALRWRKKPDDPLTYGRRIELGTVEEDFTTLEVVRYTAPLLLLKAVDEHGEQLRDFKPDSKYKTRPNAERRGTFISGALGDIGFESQPDGRWRSSSMLPDEEVTITLEKEGYTSEPQTVALKEREERELVFVLKKAE
ncbi:MAG: carboxypeptidase regulatory-like domain-containing protein [Pirellulaceae bacterium]